jgi:hypothetical protein
LPQEFEQPGTLLLGQPVGSARAVPVAQGVGGMALEVGLDPVVDNAGSHPQAASDTGGGLPLGNFEDGQGAAIHAGIVGVPELAFQTTPLPGSQGQGLHGWPPSSAMELTKNRSCVKRLLRFCLVRNQGRVLSRNRSLVPPGNGTLASPGKSVFRTTS